MRQKADRFYKMTDRIRRSGKRQKLTMLSAIFIVYVLLLSGIFAYFHSKDEVTNRLTAPQGSVMIVEPQWDSKGQYKAKASEPGMKIEKDPAGYNDGQVDLFIRLKMTVTFTDMTDAEKQNKTESYRNTYLTDAYQYRRLALLIKQIKLADGTQFITLDKNGYDSDATKWTISGCNNKKFQFEPNNKSIDPKTLEFYFYYTDGSDTAPNDSMAVVQPKNSTTNLFDYIDIPIYKKDWLGVFDQKYSITLTAEGIPAANYPDGLTVADAIGTAEHPSPFQG